MSKISRQTTRQDQQTHLAFAADAKLYQKQTRDGIKRRGENKGGEKREEEKTIARHVDIIARCRGKWFRAEKFRGDEIKIQKKKRENDKGMGRNYEVGKV